MSQRVCCISNKVISKDLNIVECFWKHNILARKYFSGSQSFLVDHPMYTNIHRSFLFYKGLWTSKSSGHWISILAAYFGAIFLPYVAVAVSSISLQESCCLTTDMPPSNQTGQDNEYLHSYQMLFIFIYIINFIW